MLSYDRRDTPIGKIAICADDNAVTGLMFESEYAGPEGFTRQNTPLIDEAFRQLTEYLEGKRQAFDIELNPKGTDFQMRVWSALRKIPFGQTMSYGDIAGRIGCLRGARAVGSAVRVNPIPVFIPCHRVIAFDGSLGGFSGGLDLKKKLLSIEGAEITA